MNTLRFFFILMLIALFCLSMSVGTSSIDFSIFLKYLFQKVPLDNSQIYILESLRFPRTMTALSVGASLGLAGLLLQMLLDNPLAEPYTLGLSGGATLGALISLIIPLLPLSLWLPLGALIGCALVTAIILLLLKNSSAFRARALILFGIMISLFCGSLVTLLLSLFDPTKLHTAIHWMMGHCGTSRDLWWPLVASTCALSTIWVYHRNSSLDSLLLGEDLALSIGTKLSRIRRETVIIVAFLTATSVALMGLVGFVGLLAPHFSHLLTKSRRTKPSLFLTLITGAILLLGADIIGRILGGETEIPAGSLVALIGAPFLMILLFKRFRDV